jgi:hypothetical protein
MTKHVRSSLKRVIRLISIIVADLTSLITTTGVFVVIAASFMVFNASFGFLLPLPPHVHELFVGWVGASTAFFFITARYYGDIYDFLFIMA